jgi:hypothetical protein
VSVIADYFVGRYIGFDEIESCVRKLSDRWLDSLHQLRSGEVGWYRRLNITDRVGIVATANAITALRSADRDVPRVHDVVRTLLSKQRVDGGWSFVSNLDDVSVVDATASVLLALYEWQNAAEFNDLNLQGALRHALDWLQEAALSEGGWGLIQAAPHRSYSTALAIQALSACGYRSAPVVQRGVHRLISEVDGGSGAWQDASRQLSVPTTAEVIRALRSAAGSGATYTSVITKACSWLLRTARETHSWREGSLTASLEEIEVFVEGRRVRVEYGHSSRPVAIGAVAVADMQANAEVVSAVRMLLDDCAAERWDSTPGGRYTDPPSWMLYDVITSLVFFRNAFPKSVDAVWSDTVRVVQHSRGEGFFTRKIREHHPKLLLIAGLTAIAWMLVAVGVVPSFGLKAFATIAYVLMLNVAGNVIFDLARDYRHKRST